ncbi:hypothetical protein [Azonexus sp.]|uniref:hypothetical protein n=1 Tax=Azonexus sp. TaxID=1872668 RepID=UPI0027B8DB8F|nr:hypothetical protein [Azonexus sp.]
MLIPVALTLLALTGGAILALLGAGSPAAVAHLAFAVGIVPLIFAAMTHFVPVLTRTGDPSRSIRRLPVFAQFAGLTAVFGMQGWLPYAAIYLAAAVDLVLALILLRWIFARARATLGSPHPGWRWYAGALVFLILALLAVLSTLVWPEQWAHWRLLHLHLNVFGLIGLAAFGTLPVLLPTVLGKPDPEAAGWLRRRFWLICIFVVLLALGAATFWPLSVMGGALFLVLVLGLIVRWIRRFGLRTLLADGASCALLAAACGWQLCLLAGALHAFGWLPARPTLWAWAAAFLLPLVTGALSQLLPVWVWPGPISSERQRLRALLVVGGQGRSVVFMTAGVLFLGGLPELATILSVSGLLWFVAGLVRYRQFRP